MVADANQNIVYINDKAKALVGKPFEKRIGEKGHHYYGLFDPETMEQIPIEKYPLSRALKGEIINNQKILLKNSIIIHGVNLSISGSPIYNEKKETTHAIIVIRDISPEEKKQQELSKDKFNLELAIQRRTERLDLIGTLLELSEEYSSEDKYLKRILQEICQYARHDVALICDWEDGNFRATKYYYFHEQEEAASLRNAIEDLIFTLEKSDVQNLYRHQPIQKNLTIKACELTDHDTFCQAHNLKSMFVCPLSCNQKIKKVLVLYSQKKHKNNDALLGFLKLLSLIVSSNLKNYRSQFELQEANKRLQQEVTTKTNEILEKEKDVERLSRVKQEFIGKISHELRTPLNAIIGYAELSIEDIKKNLMKDLSDNISKITYSAEHLLNMVSNLITITDISNTKINNTRVDPKNLLAELEEEFKFLAQNNNNLLSFSYSPHLTSFFTDYEKLKVILSSIIKNACENTRNGEVKINLSAHFDTNPHLALFTISDTGRGIEKNQLNGLFDCFNQVDNSYSRKKDGLGLGLYLSKLYADLIGAKIDVESELKKGSTFSVKLPLKT